MDLAEITPLILTYNEAANIERCLSGLGWARRIVVVDSGSTDATLEMLKAHPAVQIFQRPFDTHAQQWNFGLSGTGIDSDWILALDADYGLDVGFVEELRALTPSPDIDGYKASFVYCMDGVPLRGSLYPPVTVLFRRSNATYAQDGHTQRLTLRGQIGSLTRHLRHDDRKSLQYWLVSQARYMRLEADKLAATPWRPLDWIDRLRKLRLVAPLAVFLYCLFGKGLVLDGRAGLLYVLQRTTSEMVLSLTLLRDDLSRVRKGR